MNIKIHLLPIFLLVAPLIKSQSPAHFDESSLLKQNHKIVPYSHSYSETYKDYQLLLKGIQLAALKEFNTENLNSISNQFEIEVSEIKVVKNDIDNFCYIFPIFGTDDDENSKFYRFNEKGKVFKVAVLTRHLSEEEFVSLNLRPGTAFYYRIQILALDRYLNAYERHELQAKLKSNNLIYEFDNTTKKHKYLLSNIFETRESAKNMIKQLKSKDKKLIKSLNPMVVKYGTAEQRF